MSHNVAMDTVRSMSRDLVKIEAQRQRIEELEKELAVYKRALAEAVGYPASDYSTYGGDWEEAKKGWTERFLAIAREEDAEGSGGGVDDEA